MINDVQQKKSSSNIFAKLLSLFGRRANTDKWKLKKISKNLKKAGYRFYNFKTETVRPEFAELLYDMYKSVSPLHDFFLDNNEDEYYKSRIFNFVFSAEHKEIIDSMGRDVLRTRAEKTPLKILAEECQDKFRLLESKINVDMVAGINKLYSDVLALKNFSVLDFFGTIKRFDPGLAEGVFDDDVHFSPVEKSLVDNFIIDFLMCANVLVKCSSWESIFDFLQKLPGWKDFNSTRFIGSVEMLKKMSDDSSLLMMLQLIKGDAEFNFSNSERRSEIVRPFLESVYNEFKEAIESVAQERKQKKIAELVDSVFTANDFVSLKFYNEEGSKLYKTYGAEDFKFWEPMRYLNSFMQKCFKKDMENFMKIFTTTALDFTNILATDFGALYNDLGDLNSDISKLDQRLDENYPEGFKLKTLRENIHSDKMIGFKLNTAITEINNEAERIICLGKRIYTSMLTVFKKLYADQTRTDKVIQNWGTIDRKLGKSSRDVIYLITKDIENFLQILALYGEFN